MIISHKYKFIFIKTGKVGGTSLEIALSRFLGPNDIVTPINWTDEKERFYKGYITAQNFEKPFRSLRIKELPVWVRSKLMSRLSSDKKWLSAKVECPKLYWNHMPASAIRNYCGQRIWDSYYKFTVERNPWDKLISRYYYDPKNKKKGMSFRDYIFSGKALQSQFERYSLKGIVAVNRLIRYDRLNEEMDDVSQILDFPEYVGQTLYSISAKGNYRNDRNVVNYYDEETRRIVDIFFAREISLLGFKFGE